MTPADVESEDAIASEADAAAERAQAVEKRRKRWGCLLYAGLAILIPVLILFCTYLWFAVADRRLAEEALARARAAGDPLTTAEMQALFYPPSPAIDEATEHWKRAIEHVREAKRKVVAEKVPYVGYSGIEPDLDENGFYAESTLALVDEFLEGPGEEAILAAYDARRAGAIARFATDVPTDEPTIDDVEAPYFLRDVWYCLALDMERAAARGDLERATENVLSMVAAAEVFADDPTSYAMDLHVAMYGMSCWQARELIDRVDLSDPQLRRIDAAFAKPDFGRGLVRILQAEQWRVVRGYETNESIENEDLRIARKFPLRGADEAMTIDVFQDLLDAAKKDLLAARQAMLLFEEARADKFSELSTLDEFRYAIAIQQAYEVERYVTCATDAFAEQMLMHAGIACERYRQAHGAWPPESVEALVPEYLDEVPIDIYGKVPLILDVYGERLALHSAGYFDGGNRWGDFEESTMAFVVVKPSQR